MESQFLIFDTELSKAQQFIYIKLINYCHECKDANEDSVEDYLKLFELPLPTNYPSTSNLLSHFKENIGNIILKLPTCESHFACSCYFPGEEKRKELQVMPIQLNKTIIEMINIMSLLDCNLEDWNESDFNHFINAINNLFVDCRNLFSSFMQHVIGKHEEINQTWIDLMNIWGKIEDYQNILLAPIGKFIYYRRNGSKISAEFLRPQMIYVRGLVAKIALNVLIFDFIISTEDMTESKQVFLAGICHIIRHCYEGASLQKIVFTAPPVNLSTPAAEREAKDYTSRVALYFVRTQPDDTTINRIEVLRVDLPHKDIDKVHINCDTIGCKVKDCLNHRTFEMTEQETQNMFYDLYGYISLHLPNLSIISQGTKDEEKYAIDLLKCYTEWRHYLCTHKIDTLTNDAPLDSNLQKLSSLPEDSTLMDFMNYFKDTIN